MRILVCGSRDFRDDAKLEHVLNTVVRPIAGYARFTLIHGACPTGADAFTDTWFCNLPDRDYIGRCERYPADWSIGKSAGPLRNARMLAEGKPDVVLAFPVVNSAGDMTRGTADMVKRALAACIPVQIYPVRQ